MPLNSKQNATDKSDSPEVSRPTQTTKQRQTRKSKMTRITLNISSGLLAMVDQAAEEDFTTRSDIIRMSILWYLRPQGRDFSQVDPDEILKTLQHRQAKVGIHEMLKEITDIGVYDG